MKLILDKKERCVLCLALDVAIRKFADDVCSLDVNSDEFTGALLSCSCCVDISNQLRDACKGECGCFEDDEE